MPAKRKAGHISREAELAAWSMFFRTGHDFFRELAPLGLDALDDPKPTMKAAAEAWSRLGETFLAQWVPTEVHAKPWALVKFGRPDRKVNHHAD
jgi:hypothetical protein